MRIGARGSDLAQYQARWVQGRLQGVEIDSELVVIKTHGDLVQDRPLRDLGIQGIFTREIEEALLEDRIDLAVHSFKDLAVNQPEELAVAAITKREDPADLLIINNDAFLDEGSLLPLKQGVVVGSSAVRRQSQMLALRPDLTVKDLRGNVPTRLRKLEEGGYGAIFLAFAGVKRLGLDLKSFTLRRLDPFRFIPSPGQGALAIEMRDGDSMFDAIHQLLNDETIATATHIERQILSQAGGGCGLPLGAYACQKDRRWQLAGFWGDSPLGPVWDKVEDVDPKNMVDSLIEKLGIRG